MAPCWGRWMAPWCGRWMAPWWDRWMAPWWGWRFQWRCRRPGDMRFSTVWGMYGGLLGRNMFGGLWLGYSVGKVGWWRCPLTALACTISGPLAISGPPANAPPWNVQSAQNIWLPAGYTFSQ